MIRILHLALLLTVASTPIFTQTGRTQGLAQNPLDSPVFQRFTDEDGLPLAGVSCLFQDSKGFLWVGTFIGLYRFDGYRFAAYRRDAEDPKSISEANITSIYETRSGQIWIGTSNGLNRYDRATDGFKTFKSDAADPSGLKDSYVRNIFEDSRGTLWIGTNSGGLSKYDEASLSFTTYHVPGGSSVVSMVEDRQGGFWIATNDGLKKFDRETGAFTSYRSDGQNPNSLSDNTVRSMIIDLAGMIWIVTERGLNKFDPLAQQSTSYIADQSNPRSLNDNSVRSVFETRSGVLWIGTSSGLNRYSKETDDFTVYKHDRSNPRSLSEGDVLAIFEDNNEQLWVGTTGGLQKFNQKTSRFLRFRHDVNNPNSISKDEILSIFEDKDMILWIGTRGAGRRGELNRYDTKKKLFEVVRSFEDALIYSIHQDRQGRLWFGVNDGLIAFDRETGRLKKYKDDPNADDTSRDMLDLTVISIYQDRAGNIFAGMIGGGMRIFNPATDKFDPFQHDPKNSGSLAENRVYAILEDKIGDLWIGTGDGLNRFDPRTHRFTRYENDANNPKSISASDVGVIHEDKNGILWFGTATGGLNRFERETETFTHFKIRDGLPSDDVFEIMADEQGNLWLCTDRGLARFNIETGSVRTFNVNDGVPNNPFDNKTAFKNSSGEMYFGGQDGFVKFNPKDFTDSAFKPPIYLTDIRILEQSGMREQNVSELKELKLSWRDYVVSFDFAALDFTDPQKLQYQWKLDGFDPEWINGGTRRTATYTNLPGGDYILKVRATNVDGIWTDEALNLKISVEPPFYRTFWFAALVGLIIGFVAWRAYRFRIDQLHAVSDAQKRFTQQLINSQEAERKRIAAELHDGLGQSLVIIKNRALLGIGKRGDVERVVKELNSISESASQALDEVRDITNNLRPQLLDRLGLTKALNSMLKKVSGVIEVKSEIDSIDNLFSENEEISIYRIVQESVNNIVKHSNASEAVVRISRTGNRVSIEIEDNGTGFDAADAEEKRAGMGLIGMRERTQLLGGVLTVDSKIGAGTKIRIVVSKES